MSHALVLSLALLAAPPAAHPSPPGAAKVGLGVDAASTRPGHSDSGAGRGLAFDDLYRTQGRFVRRLLGRMGVPDSDRPDACQEVFLVVYRHLARLQGEEALRSWLFGITRRVAATFRRRPHARYEREALAPLELARAEGQLEAVASGEDLARLDRILGSLDEVQRTVFVNHELMGLPMTAIAESMGRPLQTAYSRLHAARLKIQTAVAQDRRRERER